MLQESRLAARVNSQSGEQDAFSLVQVAALFRVISVQVVFATLHEIGQIASFRLCDRLLQESDPKSPFKRSVPILVHVCVVPLAEHTTRLPIHHKVHEKFRDLIIIKIADSAFFKDVEWTT
jgi:hypothetical protein